MLLVISLEFEHVRWSWGHTSQALFRELGEDYNVVSIDHREWRKYKGEDYVRLGERSDQLHACFLSQSVTQLKDVTAYERTIARLGGNRPFENTASFRTASLCPS